MPSFTQEQLEEMVVGRQPNPSAVFFEQAVLNVQKSRELNRRVYDKKTYIKLSHVGLKDSVSYEAQKKDFDAHPEEYKYFMQNRQGEREVGIEIIPNLDIAHLQELRDYGIVTIPQLAELETVPEHLLYAHESAIIFNKALQERRNARKETVPTEEVKPENVFASNRQEHSHDVRRRGIPSGDRCNEIPESARRDDAPRCAQRDYQTNKVDNWSMEFILG